MNYLKEVVYYTKSNVRAKLESTDIKRRISNAIEAADSVTYDLNAVYDALSENLIEMFTEYFTAALNLAQATKVPSLAMMRALFAQQFDPFFEEVFADVMNNPKYQIKEPPMPDLKKNITTEPIMLTARKYLRTKLGIARGRPSVFEENVRMRLFPIVEKELGEFMKEKGPTPSKELYDELYRIINRFCDDTAEMDKIRALGKVEKPKKAKDEDESDDEDGDEKKKKKKPKSINELFINIPAELLTASPIITAPISSFSTKDLLALFAKELPSRREAKYLVGFYYQIQRMRIAFQNQRRAAIADDEPFHTLELFYHSLDSLEMQVKRVLDAYTDHDKIGWTLKQVCGVGPVIAAGLISNFDISKAVTAGSFWRYCGIDPTLPPPKKGEKLPYSRVLKTLVVYKLGESFIKVQNKPQDVYGKIYAKWKEIYTQRSEAGEYRDVCAEILRTKNWTDTQSATYKCYLEGKLPPAQIHSRARRKPLLIFISHFFELCYRVHFNCREPKPYVFEYGDPANIPGYAKESGLLPQHIHYYENPLIEIYEEKFGPIPLNKPRPKILLRDTRDIPIGMEPAYEIEGAEDPTDPDRMAEIPPDPLEFENN